jgi:hypothetical protein
MRYKFDLCFYTDDDFGLGFIPHGMRYDDRGIYSYNEEFGDLDAAVEKIDHILTKIESELHGKDYVVDDVLGMISEFRDKLILNHSTDIFVSIGGNQEGTGINFYTIPNTFRVIFECSDIESEILRNGLKPYTDETISNVVKSALLDLCSKSALENEEDS